MTIMDSPITLWTLQHRDVWQRLKTGQSYRVPDDLCWPSVEEDEELRAKLVAAYDWIADRLDHRDPRPTPRLRWPVWAHWCIGSDGPVRPDLRRYQQYAPGVMLELRVDPHRVLLTDASGWERVINDSFNGRGMNRFWNAWDNSAEGTTERARLQQAKRRSWARCLAVNPSHPTQGVLWEIRPEDVVSHCFFKGHPELKWP